jgi:hypothetical protein
MTARLRTLPIALPPVHHETIGSYLNRLADANRLKLATLAGLLGLSRRWRRDHDNADDWTHQTINRLAVLAGHPAAALIHALPALPDHMTPQPTGPAVLAVGAACHRCMIRHGIRGLVVRRAFSHECVCLRHHCWLGGTRQHLLGDFPDILHANKRHRRVLRRAGPATHLAYQHALAQVTDWFHAGQPELRHRWTQRLNRMPTDPYADPHHPGMDIIEFACYPETVTMTGVLASPHWRQHPDRLSEALRRTRALPAP